MIAPAAEGCKRWLGRVAVFGLSMNGTNNDPRDYRGYDEDEETEK
jgi:hypothetical protein